MMHITTQCNVTLACIHQVANNAPLSNNFLIPQNFASASERDITFQWYHNFIINHITLFITCEQ